jgi:hypothetical protein
MTVLFYDEKRDPARIQPHSYMLGYAMQPAVAYELFVNNLICNLL